MLGRDAHICTIHTFTPFPGGNGDSICREKLVIIHCTPLTGSGGVAIAVVSAVAFAIAVVVSVVVSVYVAVHVVVIVAVAVSERVAVAEAIDGAGSGVFSVNSFEVGPGSGIYDDADPKMHLGVCLARMYARLLSVPTTGRLSDAHGRC